MAKYFKKFIASLIALTLGLNAAIAFAADTTAPSDVTGLTAYSGDGQVTLEWDPSTDDTAVTGYYVYSGLSSVSEDGGSYTFGSTDAGDVTSYTLEGLSNDVTYYFAVTAYDAEGNESEYYSNEVESMPTDGENGDFTSPTVQAASAATNSMVEVTFSEAVTLPDDAASAFNIEASDGTALEILDAYVSGDDPETVFIVTELQTAGAQYTLTAGIEVSDEAGNSIISGTSDTAIFTGSSLEKTEGADETAASDTFTVKEVDSVSTTELRVTFSEEPVTGDATDFTIADADDASITFAVTEVTADDTDPLVLVLKTEELDAGYDYVLSISEYVLNLDSNALDEDSREFEFTAKTVDLSDVIAPEDVTNFFAELLGTDGVKLTWEASLDTAGDLANYLVYTSADNGLTWGTALEIAKTATSQEIKGLTAGQTYTFKITAVDENGNESAGVEKQITLPETGPGMYAIFGLSLLGGAYWARRRRAYN